MTTKRFLFLLLTTTSTFVFVSNADESCIGFTSVNSKTHVAHNGPLRFMNCSCPCSKKLLANGTCTECNHRHAGDSAFQNYSSKSQWRIIAPDSEDDSSEGFSCMIIGDKNSTLSCESLMPHGSLERDPHSEDFGDGSRYEFDGNGIPSLFSDNALNDKW